MRLTLDTGDRSLFIKAIQASRDAEAPRTGLHCSSIINDILQTTQAERPPMGKTLTYGFQETGNIVEDVLAEGLAKRIPGWVKPKPKQYEGVICSPDGWSPRIRCIDEVKVTWKGLREFMSMAKAGKLSDKPYDFADVLEMEPDQQSQVWEIVTQSPKLHGYIMQTLYYMVPWHAARARLHVFFLNGNYRPPFPEPVTINLRPTAAEIQTNYRMVRQHAIDRKMLIA